MALRTIEVNTKEEFDNYRTLENNDNDYLYLCKYDKTIRLSDNGTIITFMSEYYQMQNESEVAIGELFGNTTYQRTISITKDMLENAIPENIDSYNGQIVIAIEDANADATNAWIHDGYVTRVIGDDTYNMPISGIETNIGVSSDCSKVIIDYVSSIFSEISVIMLTIRYAINEG